MNLCLGMLYCDRDLPWLKLHLPVYLSVIKGSPFILGYDHRDFSEESHRFISNLDADVQLIDISFEQDWSAAWNKIIHFANWLNQHMMLRLDPDELMFPDEIRQAAGLLDHYALVSFPRWNFWYDRLQVNVHARPDMQYRAWRLDGRVTYQGKRHEVVRFGGHAREVYQAKGIYIYHYGDIGMRNIYDRALRYINYERMDKGLPLLDEIPSDRRPGATTEPFTGSQPLDPAICGIYAPFVE